MPERRYRKLNAVYLLLGLNDKRPGKVYIGYTVDPERRLKQHNGGIEQGGSKKTHNKGPWVMILLVHGFPTEVTALKFEWAWQNPFSSKHLKYILDKEKTTETNFEYCLKVLEVMLKVKPWKNIVLSLKWFNPSIPDLYKEFLRPYRYDTLLSFESDYRILNDTELVRETADALCFFCRSRDLPTSSSSTSTANADSSVKLLYCIYEDCDMFSHVLCLANYFLRGNLEDIIPTKAPCPLCRRELIWSEIVGICV